MSQLKNDYKYLNDQWINEPSQITSVDLVKYDDDTQLTINRYKHLLINKIFLDKSTEEHTIGKAMPTWINNWKKELLQKIKHEWINEDIITYPLEQIYSYLDNNVAKLKWKNIKQMDIADVFWIKNLWTFYRIVKALWFIKKLEWKLINLSVKKFAQLNVELKRCEIQKGKVESLDIIEIAKKININNPEYIYTWISALGYAKKYKIHKLKITKIEVVEEIIEHVKELYWEKKSIIFNRDRVLNIVSLYEDSLWKNEKENITKVTWLLRYYDYEVWDIREYKN